MTRGWASRTGRAWHDARMESSALVGGVLASGLLIFLVGAAAWRLDYQRPLPESLPLVHRDRRRWTWIHVWMMTAMVVTPAGLAGLASALNERTAAVLTAMAAAVYCVHMLTAYVGSAVLGGAVIFSDALPTWLGWTGVGWGLAFAAGLVATRFAGPFNPPFWAHLYTGTVGVFLLLR